MTLLCQYEVHFRAVLKFDFAGLAGSRHGRPGRGFLGVMTLVRHAIDNGTLASHVKNLRSVYRGRVEAMDDALHQHFSGIARWTRPDGGYFFWVQFDESVDTAVLNGKAHEHEAGFQPGAVFSTQGQFRNFARLSFAHYDEDDIREGIARIRPLFD